MLSWYAILPASGETLLSARLSPGQQPAVPLRVNIFGDGNPHNGIEDDRIDMSSPAWNSDSRRSWNMGAGTIHCDGKNRGSAVIVDTRSMGGPKHGLIIATSAHVVFDLEENQRFQQCRFHYMALDSLPGYQANIDLEASVLGPFEPQKDRLEPDFGKHDWAFLYVPDPAPGISDSGRIQLLSFAKVNQLEPGEVSYQFIAFSRSTGSISISTHCTVTESTSTDLGGGAWRGQLLDDCDSEGGASGGGLVADVDGQNYLVAIRSGAHWNSDAFPKQEFPSGPPDGSNWDVASNTNFSRAIDEELINALNALVRRLSDQRDSHANL